MDGQCRSVERCERRRCSRRGSRWRAASSAAERSAFAVRLQRPAGRRPLRPADRLCGRTAQKRAALSTRAADRQRAARNHRRADPEPRFLCIAEPFFFFFMRFNSIAYFIYLLPFIKHVQSVTLNCSPSFNSRCLSGHNFFKRVLIPKFVTY